MKRLHKRALVLIGNGNSAMKVNKGELLFLQKEGYVDGSFRLTEKGRVTYEAIKERMPKK